MARSRGASLWPGTQRGARGIARVALRRREVAPSARGERSFGNGRI